MISFPKPLALVEPAAATNEGSDSLSLSCQTGHRMKSKLNQCELSLR